jgi:HAD superfamily hydrolase (TIGR01549 family)
MTTDKETASERPAGIETILFDAGGVLLELDLTYLKRLIEAKRIEISMADLKLAELRARAEIHRYVASGGRVSEGWRYYFSLILDAVHVPGEEHEKMIDALWQAHEKFGLWTIATTGGPQIVARLKSAGYRIAVVSNAEGRVARDLASAGYEGMFETVIDSHDVGVEKPDPAIFAIALERLGVSAAGAVFIGDIPAVDVAGARAAGIRPILMAVPGTHDDVDVPRIASLGELPELLETLPVTY